MNTLQLLVLVAGSFCLISWADSEGVVGREYLPAALPVVTRKLLPYPIFNHYQPIYPQYTTPYYPPYGNSFIGGNGFIGGYHQQQQQILGQHYNTGVTGIGLGGYYPNADFAPALKPRADAIDTVYDANGGYVYGKKK